MKIKTFLLAAVMMASPLVSGAAGTAADQLKSFIRAVPAAQGEFSQHTRDAAGNPQSTQMGTFVFRRPGQFRWDVLKPYEQQIVSDGKQLYQYDPDLAQVTVRGVDASIGTSPAAILFGTASLESSFQLSEEGQQEGLDWLRAKPLSPDAGFAYVDIGFKQGKPQRLLLKDAFDQTTLIEFSSLQVNPNLPADTFTFTAPEGVDVVEIQ